MRSFYLIIAFILIINLVSASDKITIKDNNNVELLNITLVYNTDFCSECEALLYIETDKNLEKIIDGFKFKENNLNSWNEIPFDYYIYILEDDISLKKKYKSYSLNDINNKINKKGTYYLKLKGYKQADKMIDWIGSFLGFEIDKWMIWGSTLIYDEINDSSLNYSLWSNASSDISVSENANSITLNATSTGSGVHQGTLTSINLPDITLIQNISFRFVASLSQSVSNNPNYALISFGGKEVKKINCQSSGCTNTSDSIFSLKRSYETVDYNFSVYEDGVLIKTINASNNNITMQIYHNNDGAVFTTQADIYYLYYILNKTDYILPNLTIISPNGTYTGITYIPINITANDDIDIDYCYYNVTRGASAEVANTRIANCLNSTFTVSGDGNYMIYVTVNDTSGNINTSSSAFTTSSYIPPASPGSNTGGGGWRLAKDLTANVYTPYCDPIKPNFETAYNNFLIKQSFDNFKILWFSFWDYGLCKSAASIVPLELEISED